MSPFRSAARVANYDLPFVDWMVGDIFINQSKIGAITSPILLLHGQHDEVVAVSHSKVGFKCTWQSRVALLRLTHVRVHIWMGGNRFRTWRQDATARTSW